MKDVTLTWADPSAATKIEISRGTIPDDGSPVNYHPLATVPVGVQTLLDAQLGDGNYSYQAIAVNDSDPTAAPARSTPVFATASVVTVTPVNAQPDPVGNFQATVAP